MPVARINTRRPYGMTNVLDPVYTVPDSDGQDMEFGQFAVIFTLLLPLILLLVVISNYHIRHNKCYSALIMSDYIPGCDIVTNYHMFKSYTLVYFIKTLFATNLFRVVSSAYHTHQLPEL